MAESCEDGFTCKYTCFHDPVDANLKLKIEGKQCGDGKICCKDGVDLKELDVDSNKPGDLYGINLVLRI